MVLLLGGAIELTVAHIQRLTVLLPTHVRRTRSPHVSRVERRPCDRVACLVSVGGSTGGRTFRGAISARVHPRRSPLALWPCQPHSAYGPVVSALFRRSLRDLDSRNDVIDAPAGTRAGTPSRAHCSHRVTR